MLPAWAGLLTAMLQGERGNGARCWQIRRGRQRLAGEQATPSQVAAMRRSGPWGVAGGRALGAHLRYWSPGSTRLRAAAHCALARLWLNSSASASASSCSFWVAAVVMAWTRLGGACSAQDGAGGAQRLAVCPVAARRGSAWWTAARPGPGRRAATTVGGLGTCGHAAGLPRGEQPWDTVHTPSDPSRACSRQRICSSGWSQTC